jgi:hypothetical protein
MKCRGYENILFLETFSLIIYHVIAVYSKIAIIRFVVSVYLFYKIKLCVYELQFFFCLLLKSQQGKAEDAEKAPKSSC